MTNNRRLSSVACLPVIFYIDFPAKSFVSFHQRFLHGICTMRCCIVPRRETPVFSPERGVVINTFHFVRLIREMRHAALRACFFLFGMGIKSYRCVLAFIRPIACSPRFRVKVPAPVKGSRRGPRKKITRFRVLVLNLGADPSPPRNAAHSRVTN